jgi:hypothetical protein
VRTPSTVRRKATYFSFRRAKIVVYDLVKDVRYTLTPKWDRSPDGLAVQYFLRPSVASRLIL